MAGKFDLAPLLPFDPLSEPSFSSQQWNSWIKRFKAYIVTMKITDNKQKSVLLLYQVGEATQEIFDTLQNTGNDYQNGQTTIRRLFHSQTRMSIFKFYSFIKQLSSQTKRSISLLQDYVN